MIKNKRVTYSPDILCFQYYVVSLAHLHIELSRPAYTASSRACWQDKREPGGVETESFEPGLNMNFLALDIPIFAYFVIKVAVLNDDPSTS